MKVEGRFHGFLVPPFEVWAKREGMGWLVGAGRVGLAYVEGEVGEARLVGATLRALRRSGWEEMRCFYVGMDFAKRLREEVEK